ncbi:MAG: hypothetical protein HGB23_01855 [Chlorobiaceae bacterium]|nr:hypothetical protein [Chlorobiaceae bacterium]
MLLYLISILIPVLMLLWVVLIDRKYVYRSKIISALPPTNSFANYQKGICDIHNKISPDKCINDKKRQTKYFSILAKRHKGLWIPFWSIIYRLFSSRYFAYNQFSVVYISSYGGISEVSRRKITSDGGIKKLKKLREDLKYAVVNNEKAEIIANLADIYRFMYDLDKDNAIDSMRVGYLVEDLEEVCRHMCEKDLVNAYICWRSKEKYLNEMSDMEIIIYGSIRLHLEKYIISYEYPVNPKDIEDDIEEFSNMLKATLQWITMDIFQKVKFLSNLSVIMMLDLLGSRIEYKV